MATIEPSTSVRPAFHRPLLFDRARERERLGLDPHRPTGVVMYGGQGAMVMLTIARQLHDVQLVLMCGHNATLAQHLRTLNPAAPQHVVGFTSDLRHHLALGDFFIGKPEPGSLSEALQMGLPVLTVRNAWTLPQERFNTDWVQAQDVGVVGSSWRHTRPLVQLLLEQLPRHQAAVRRHENNAVFEVPEVLAGVLAQAQAGARRQLWPVPAGAQWFGTDNRLSAEPFP